MRSSVAARQPGCGTSFSPRRPAKSEGLGLLFDALGGAAAVARLFGRDPSTVAKRCTGALPLPAETVAALRDEAIRIARCPLAEVRCLEEEIPAAERRAGAAPTGVPQAATRGR